MHTITVTHPDYKGALSAKLKALGAERYQFGFIIHDVATGPGRKPKFVDLMVKAHTWPENRAAHTVRMWRHGPVTFMDCDHGPLSGQDTMRLFGAANDCPACSALMQAIRAHRGLGRIQWYVSGSSLLSAIWRMWNDSETYGRFTRRETRDSERATAVALCPDKGTLRQRVDASVRARARDVAYGTDLSGWTVNVKTGTGFMSSAACHKRGWGKGNKRVLLTVPASAWLKAHRHCRGVMDGKLVGAVLRTSPDELTCEAIAFKVQSPVDSSAWWYATFRREDPRGEWRFDKWRRNGAVGSEGGGK